MEVHIGLEIAASPDAIDILGEPAKPGNWKQETYEEKLEELRQKKLETAHNDLRTGLITGAAMTVHKDGKTSTIDVDPVNLSGILRECLKHDDTVCGLGIKYRLMQAVWNGQLKGYGVTLVTEHNSSLKDAYCILKAEKANMLMTDFLGFWEPRVSEAVDVRAAMAVCKYKEAARQSAVSYGISKAVLSYDG